MLVEVTELHYQLLTMSLFLKIALPLTRFVARVALIRFRTDQDFTNMLFRSTLSASPVKELEDKKI